MDLKTYSQTAKKKYPDVSPEDVDLIIASACNLPRLELFLNAEREISIAEEATLDAFLQRRTQKEPLQYIFGEAPFRELNLFVGQGVLIPRPETEILVDLALDGLPENSNICDVGTGSGAIALALALANPQAQITALDISEDALKFARKNIDRYQVGNIQLMKSDLLSAVAGCSFDLITANLPYVSSPLYESLDCEVRDFEPESALLSGDDGLEHIRCLATEAKGVLLSGGRIIFEFSPEQEEAIVALMHDNNYCDVVVVKDLNERARFLIVRK